jgi:hypothetical protein
MEVINLENIIELRITVKELVKNLIVRITEISDLMKNGQYEQGNERLIFLFEDLVPLIQAIHLLISYHHLNFDLDDLNYKLDELSSNLENKDYLYTADILKFEILPLLEELDGCITND